MVPGRLGIGYAELLRGDLGFESALALLSITWLPMLEFLCAPLGDHLGNDEREPTRHGDAKHNDCD